MARKPTDLPQPAGLPELRMPQNLAEAARMVRGGMTDMNNCPPPPDMADPGSPLSPMLKKRRTDGAPNG